MQTIYAQKLKELRNSLGLTQKEFAKACSISTSLINAIESDGRNISKNLNLKIKELYNIDILEAVNIEKYADVKLPDNIISLPFYRVGAAAGEGTRLEEEEPCQETMYFDKNFIKCITSSKLKNLHLIYARGNSMDSGWNQPSDIHDGDLLLIDTSKISGDGKVFVFLQNNELRVKKISFQNNNLIISSYNKNYPEETYPINKFNMEIKVIGQVIWNGNKGVV